MRAKITAAAPYWRVAFSLFCLIWAAYFITYRGYPSSTDTVALFSATESLVKYGSLDLVSLYSNYPNADLNSVPDPWYSSVHEPLQILSAAPLYWLAQQSNSLGLIHSVWLFNLFIGAGLVTLFYLGSLSLGYSSRAALIGALALAFGSSLWPYSQTFFREPLAAFWLLLAVLIAFRLHQAPNLKLIAVLLLAFTAATLTKTANLLALPTLLWILWPTDAQWAWLRGRGRRFNLVLLIALPLFILLLFGLALLITPQSERLSPQSYLNRMAGTDLDYLLTVFGAYWLSIGRSLWANAPFLLLAPLGGILLYRRGQKRLSLAPFILLLSFTLGYGLGGWEWHGGRGWGTRYLLPVLPVMALLTLPVFETLINAKNRLWYLAAALLIAFSVLIQFGGVFVPLDHFYGEIQAAFPDDFIAAYYDEGTWQPAYTQWWLSLRAFDPAALDLAWRFANPPWLGAVLGAGLIALSGWSLVYWRRVWLIALPLYIALASFLGLLSLRADSRYGAERDDLQALLQSVKTRAGAGDILYLDNPDYQYFFMNFYGGQARLVTLPYAPGERYSPDQIIRVEDADSDGVISFNERITPGIRVVLEHGRYYEKIWLVTRFSPYQTWAYRPIEAFLSQHYFTVEEIEHSPNARLIRFEPIPVSLHHQFAPNQTEYQFGAGLWLAAYDFPESIQAGAVLPVILNWDVRGGVDFDYNISLALVDAEGGIIAQRDGRPQGGFGLTSEWLPDFIHLDNHGLALPPILAAGDYRLRVVLYDWRDVSRQPVYVDAQPIGDEAIIGTVTVTP